MDVVKTLDYSSETPRRKFWSRTSIRIVTSLGVLAIAYFWGPISFQILISNYWQYRALHYAPPSNHVVLDVLHGGTDTSPPGEADLIIGHLYLSSMPNSKIVFMHLMHKPDGTTRFVYLRTKAPIPSPDPYWPEPLVYACESLSLPLRSRLDVSVATGNFFDLPNPYKHLKVFEGQLDPSDGTHFTFDYDVDDHRRTVDCWLKNDGMLLMFPRP